MAHRNRQVRLVVEETRDCRNRVARDQLSDEDDRATIGRRSDPTAHVKPEIDLLEVPVPGNREAVNPRVGEEEPDEAHERLALPDVEFSAARDEGQHHGGRDLVIQNDEVGPARGEERSTH